MLGGCTSFLLSSSARLTLLMLQLQLNLCQPGRDNRRKNKGSADMKESTMLPKWKILCSFLLLLLLLNKMRDLSVSNVAVNQCIYSKTSEVKTLLCSHMWRSMHSQRAFIAGSLRSHKFWDVCRGVHMGHCRHEWLTNFTSRIPERTPAIMESVNWP